MLWTDRHTEYEKLWESVDHNRPKPAQKHTQKKSSITASDTLQTVSFTPRAVISSCCPQPVIHTHDPWIGHREDTPRDGWQQVFIYAMSYVMILAEGCCFEPDMK